MHRQNDKQATAFATTQMACRKEEKSMDWMALLTEIGFPVLVTFYLLTRIESKLEQLSLSIQTLSNKVAQLPSTHERAESQKIS